MKTPKRDPHYHEAYYPYYDPEKHRADGPPKPRTFAEPLNRYTHNIYQNDQKPYYGPPHEYRMYTIPLGITHRRVRIFIKL